MQAGNSQGHYDPLEMVLLSVCIELIKKIDSLEQKQKFINSKQD
jgi:hypothetical protein